MTWWLEVGWELLPIVLAIPVLFQKRWEFRGLFIFEFTLLYIGIMLNTQRIRDSLAIRYLIPFLSRF
mgnify:FL=1